MEGDRFGEMDREKLVAVTSMRPERIVLRFSLRYATRRDLTHIVRERPRDYEQTTARYERGPTGFKMVDNVQKVAVVHLEKDIRSAGYEFTEVFWQQHHNDSERFFLWLCFDTVTKSEIGGTKGAEGFRFADHCEEAKQTLLQFVRGFIARYAHVYANPAVYAGQMRRNDMVDLTERGELKVKRFKRGHDPRPATLSVEGYLRYDASCGYSVESVGDKE